MSDNAASYAGTQVVRVPVSENPTPKETNFGSWCWINGVRVECPTTIVSDRNPPQWETKTSVPTKPSEPIHMLELGGFVFFSCMGLAMVILASALFVHLRSAAQRADFQMWAEQNRKDRK